VCGLQERGPVASLIRPRAVAFAIAVIVVVADWVTTRLALDHLHQAQHVWGPFGLDLTFNSGFAFSLFSGRAVFISVLLCLGLVVLAAIVWRVRTFPLAVGAGLILGGAAGNLAERIFGGHGGQVPDFVTLNFWPTFNLADACVTIGVLVVVVTLLVGAAPVVTGEPPGETSAPAEGAGDQTRGESA
jgi:signal peptidase II